MKISRPYKATAIDGTTFLDPDKEVVSKACANYEYECKCKLEERLKENVLIYVPSSTQRETYFAYHNVNFFVFIKNKEGYDTFIEWIKYTDYNNISGVSEEMIDHWHAVIINGYQSFKVDESVENKICYYQSLLKDLCLFTEMNLTNNREVSSIFQLFTKYISGDDTLASYHTNNEDVILVNHSDMDEV